MTNLTVRVKDVSHIASGATTQSVAGLTCRVVHINKEAGLCWVVNPATDQVCRVALSDLRISVRATEKLLRDFTKYQPTSVIEAFEKGVRHGKRATRDLVGHTPIRCNCHERQAGLVNLAKRGKSVTIPYTDELIEEIRLRRDSGFILWNPQSKLPPQVQYPTLGEARCVSRIMAQRNPGQTFNIMLKVGSAKLDKRKVERVVVEEVEQLKED